MATLRSLLDRFKSISRPSLTSSAGSGSYSSLAKKQATAEDAIADNMYSSGDLSADAYKTQLNQRLLRAWNTPAQVVSIRTKLNDVDQVLQDTQIQADYAAGKYTTAQMRDYEQQKLDAMTEPNSTAYIKQQQKVQSLTDKAEKESRASYRVSENLRISQLPEDSSANLLEKAKLYQTLSDQARLDGDSQQADTYLTQANNYVSSAKRADINDLITSTRLSVSATPSLGGGVPSAESGLTILNQLLGRSTTANSGSTAGGGVSQGQNGSPGLPAPSAVSTGFSGYNTPAIKNKLESLDSKKKSLDNLYQDQADTNAMIATYKNAIAQASGDQKTQLTIALNNLIDRASGIQNSIDNSTQDITDIVISIQEAQQKVAASAFNQEVRANNLQFDKAETELETAFKKGQIDKFEYISKGAQLAATKAQFYGEASGIYNQFGNDASAETYLQKASGMQDVTDSLVSVAQNIDDYEPIFNDGSGSLTNLLGKKVNKGDVILQDVRQLRDSGRWDQNYTNVNGVYHRIYYKDLPAEYKDAEGYVLPNVANNANVANYFKNAYVYTIGNDGKVNEENISFVKVSDGQGGFSREAIPESRLQRLISDKTVTRDKNGDLTWYTSPAEPSGLLKAAAGVQALSQKVIPGLKNVPEIVSNAGKQLRSTILSNPAEAITNPLGTLARSAGQGISNYVSPLIEKASGFIGNLFQKAKDVAGKAISIIKNPVATAYAAPAENAKNPYNNLIASVFGEDAANANQILRYVDENGVVRGENTNYQAQLDVPNRTNPVTGQWDNNAPVRTITNPFTGQKEASVDRGLFRINNATFYDYLKRMPGVLAQAGIKSWDDMNDPLKNTKMAKIIADNQGYDAWFAANPEIKSGKTTYSEAQTPDIRTRNIELALGLTPGTYRKGMSIEQERIDKALRSNDPNMISLLKSEGIYTEPKPVATIAPTISKPSSSQGGGAPSFNIPKIDIPSIASNVGKAVSSAASNVGKSVSSYFNPTSNAGQNFWSTPVAQGLANIQRSVQNVTQPVVNTVKNTVSNVVSSVSNALKKLKFW